MHPGWLTRPSEVQEGLACANCMASARGSEAFAWHPRSARAGSERDSERGFACLCLCPCVAPVLGPSRNSNAAALPFADACCVASVSPQAGARAFVRLPAKVYFVYYTCTDRLRPLSWSCQSVFPYYTCTEKLRLLCRSCQSAFPLLHMC